MGYDDLLKSPRLDLWQFRHLHLTMFHHFSWFEMNCLLLDDPVRKLRLQTFSQPLMIPAAAVKRMKDATPSSYPLRQSGFAVTVGQAMAEEFNVRRFYL